MLIVSTIFFYIYARWPVCDVCPDMSCPSLSERRACCVCVCVRACFCVCACSVLCACVPVYCYTSGFWGTHPGYASAARTFARSLQAVSVCQLVLTSLFGLRP